MKHAIQLSIVAFSLIVSGCKSTDSSNSQSPTIKVTSTKEHQWDSNKSFALNISDMTASSGIGVGVKDVDNPGSAGIDLDGTGDKVFNAISAFHVGGLLNSLSMVNLINKNNGNLKWTPSTVTFIPKSEIANPASPDAYYDIRERVISHFNEALSLEYRDAKPVKVAFSENYRGTPITNVFYKGDVCEASLDFAKEGIDKEFTLNYDWTKQYAKYSELEGFDYTGTCHVIFATFVSGTYQDNHVVVSKLFSSFEEAFLSTMILKSNALMIMPQLFEYYSGGMEDVSAKSVLNYGANKVSYKNKIYLFDKNEISSPLIVD